MELKNNLTITTEELIASVMILTNKTSVNINEVENFVFNIAQKIKHQNIQATILFNSKKLKNFVKEYADQFYVTNSKITLKQNLDIDWLITNFIEHLNFKILQLLGFINLRNKDHARFYNPFEDEYNDDDEYIITEPYKVLEIEERHPGEFDIIM